MPWTIAELASRLYVDPGDIETAISAYPEDVENLWSEAGVLSDLACNDLDTVFNPFGVRTAPELFPTMPVGVVMMPRRVARVAGDNLVHRHSMRARTTRCGRNVDTSEDGAHVSETESPCERCFDPDV